MSLLEVLALFPLRARSSRHLPRSPSPDCFGSFTFVFQLPPLRPATLATLSLVSPTTTAATPLPLPPFLLGVTLSFLASSPSPLPLPPQVLLPPSPARSLPTPSPHVAPPPPYTATCFVTPVVALLSPLLFPTPPSVLLRRLRLFSGRSPG